MHEGNCTLANSEASNRENQIPFRSAGTNIKLRKHVINQVDLGVIGVDTKKWLLSWIMDTKILRLLLQSMHV